MNSRTPREVLHKPSWVKHNPRVSRDMTTWITCDIFALSRAIAPRTEYRGFYTDRCYKVILNFFNFRPINDFFHANPVQAASNT